MSNNNVSILDYKNQMSNGFLSLRFERELEAVYREQQRLHHRPKQLTTIAVGSLILLLLFPIDLASLPQQITPLYFLFRLALAMPFLIFVTACHFMDDLHKYISLASLATLHIISLGTTVLYVVSAHANYHFPYEGIIVVLMVTFFTAGLRFSMAMGSAVATLLTFEIATLLFLPTELRHPADSFYLLATILCGSTGAYSVEYQKRKSFLQNAIVEDLTTKDRLTGLFNRTAMMDKLNNILQYAKHEDKYITLYLADIDCFKAYNDNYGHIAGDKCLKQVADTLAPYCHGSLDFAGRYGGEEFLLVWFDTNPRESHALINRINEKIASLNIPHEDSIAAPHITISGGFVSLIPHDNTSVETLLHHADMALHNAKHKGRNQVSPVATPEFA